MGELLTMISLTKNISTDDARGWLTDLCGDAVAKLGGAASIELMGDPSFSIEGVGVRLNFRAFIPGGKGSGSYVMTFNRSGQEQTFTFRDITPFIEDGDKLVLVVDSVGYDFKLKQKLVAKIKLAIIPVPIDTVEKTVSWTCPTRAFSESDFKVELPITKSADIIQSLRINPGTTSAMVSWSSPEVPLKGTVTAYNASNNKVKEVSESTFKNAHNTVITGLQSTTNYRFVVTCLNTSGETISAGEVSTTTTAKTVTYQERLTDTTLQITDTGTATAGTNTIDFQWTTSKNSSTEVILSPSPDLTAASVPCIKKTSGTIQGWGTRGGNRVYETNHVISATELEPGTKYYYLLRSYIFQDDDDTKNNIETVGHLGEITTQPLPELPSVKIKVQFGTEGLAQIPVIVKKPNDASFRLVMNTTSEGFTPLITLDKGGRYTFSVENNLYFQDITSSPVTISASAQGEQSSVTLSLTARPSPGAYVFNAAGQPLSGATVKIVGNTSYTATTDAAGLYKFGTLPVAGNIQLEVSKTDYATKRVKGRIVSFGGVKIFSADNATLESAIATLTITVKQPGGAALNNVSVKVKEGAVLASLTTNAQGKAVFTYNFGDNNSQYHSLTITAEKTGSSLKIAPNSTTTSMKGGTTQSIDISCLVDTSSPVLSNVSFKQTTTYILAAFTTSEQGEYSVEVKYPSGQTSTTIPWSAVTSNTVPGRVVANLADGIGTGGLCKINIKFRDAAGNEAQTGWIDFYFMTSTTWNLKASAVNADTALLSWSKYPRPAEFTKYEIVKTITLTGTGGDVVATLTDLNTTTYRITGLQPNTDYRYLLRSPGAEGLPVAATINFKTLNALGQAPVITNFTVTPAACALNEDVNVAALISDPDSNIEGYKLLLMTDKDKQELKQQKNIAANSVQVVHTFKPSRAGKFTLKLTANDAESSVEQEIPFTVLSSERPVLKFVKAPAGFIANKASSIALDLTNKAKVSGQLEFSINWGDGTQQTLKVQAQKGKILIDKSDSQEAQTKGTATEVEHTYGTIGDFTITVNASLITEEKATLTAEPLAAAVTVTAQPTVVTLSEDKTKSTDNLKYFKIKAAGGSYKVTNWTITYGDSRSESGTGDVDKQVSHNYGIKGDYEIEFIVNDSGNNEIKKLAAVRIRNNAAQGSAGGTLQQTQTDTTQQQQVGATKKTTAKQETKPGQSAVTRQQETKQADAEQVETKAKAVPLKVTIKTVTLEGEENSIVPAGKPVKIEVEIESSADIAVPINANLKLKLKTETQEFTKKIKNLKKGVNTFTWDLIDKALVGQYALSIEILNEEPKLNVKKTKIFKVVEP
jgi:hypothetical protein